MELGGDCKPSVWRIGGGLHVPVKESFMVGTSLQRDNPILPALNGGGGEGGLYPVARGTVTTGDFQAAVDDQGFYVSRPCSRALQGIR